MTPHEKFLLHARTTAQRAKLARLAAQAMAETMLRFEPLPLRYASVAEQEALRRADLAHRASNVISFAAYKRRISCKS